MAINIQNKLIMVDDSSKNNTESQILRFIEMNPAIEVKYYKHEVNKGKGTAFYTGIKQAT